MTKKQRLAERDFWLGCAKRAFGDSPKSGYPFLCHQTRRSGREAYTEHLQLFRPDEDIVAWWQTGVTDEGSYGHGPAEGRVLAACFLAAMAEAGDLDDLTI